MYMHIYICISVDTCADISADVSADISADTSADIVADIQSLQAFRLAELRGLLGRLGLTEGSFGITRTR